MPDRPGREGWGREAVAVHLPPAGRARRGARGAGGGRATTARCWPAGRACCRCCPCGWPRPATWSTSTGSATWPSCAAAPTACGSGRLCGTPAWSGTAVPAACCRCCARRCGCVAHPTIRNRGTPVGSLVHADPSGELTAVLALTGGSVELASASGRRTVTADEFFLGPLESAVRPGELAVEAFFPALPPGTGTAFVEVARRHGDYAMCGVARGGDAATRPVRCRAPGPPTSRWRPVPVVLELPRPGRRPGRPGVLAARRASGPRTGRTRNRTCTPAPSTAGTSPGCSPHGRWPRLGAGRRRAVPPGRA